MIFVTVGTANYDPLISQIDHLVAEGKIKERIVAQIGRGSYIPKNLPYFRFLKSLEPAYACTNLVVSTGGAGTTLECARKGLPLVVVENKTLMEGHQAQLIAEMERKGHLIWCKRLEDLDDCITEAKRRKFEPYNPDQPIAHLLIKELLEN